MKRETRQSLRRTDAVKTTRFEYDFGNTGYCGILSDSFAVIWCDNDFLFRRLLRFKASLLDEFSSSDGKISRIFKVEGTYYNALIERLVNNSIMCRIFPALTKERLARTSIYRSSGDICHNALNIMHLADEIKMLSESGNVKRLLELNAALSGFAEEIYDYSLSVMRFSAPNNTAVYIHFRKYFLDTMRRLLIYVSGLEKDIHYCIDIERDCLKIDYNTFEIALLNLVKLFYKVSPDKAPCTLSVTDGAEGTENSLILSTVIPFGEGFDEKILKSSINTEKSLFSSMGGIVSFTEADNEVRIEGIIPVSYASSRKDSEDTEVLHLNCEAVWQDDDNSEYISLYRRDNGRQLCNNTQRLEDETENDNISVILGFLLK